MSKRSVVIDGDKMEFVPRKKSVDENGRVVETGGYFYDPLNPNIQYDPDKGNRIYEVTVIDVVGGVLATIPTLFK